jgi:hypothetical protein
MSILKTNQSNNASQIHLNQGLMIILLLLTSLFCIFVISGSANPIPVYPDPSPHFQPSRAVSDVQESSFVTWLLLVWCLDIGANTVFLYGGFYILSFFNLSSTSWFNQIPRQKMITAILLLSIGGILSEWLIGSWLGGFFFIGLIVFFLVYLFGSYYFDLDRVSTMVLSVYMVIVNLISWTLFILFI